MAGKMQITILGSGTCVRTHFYLECDNVHIAAQAEANFGGPVVPARDLLLL